MPDWAHLGEWHSAALTVALVMSAIAIGFAGVRAAQVAAGIVAATRLGQAVVGAVLLGAGTSLPEAVVTVRSSLQGNFDLTISNAVGGVVVQTVMLVVADTTMRRRNMEYASRHATPILQAALLATMLSFIVLAALGPVFAIWLLHPVSLLLVAGYVTAQVIAHRAHLEPVWVRPGRTKNVEREEETSPESRPASSIGDLALRYLLLMTVLGVASFVLTDAATILGGRTGVSETVVGGLVIAFATSLPELVTAIGAIREQAVTMAIADVLGGNLFDAMFPALADLLQGPGSVYGVVHARTLFLTALGVAVTSMLIVELTQPPRRGLFSIGAMSIAIVMVAIAGFTVLIAW